MIAGIVLAAGTSRRLGQPKQLLPLGGGTVLGRTLATALASLDRAVVVLGAHADVIRSGVDLRGAEVVVNGEYATGQASSLCAGIVAMAEDAAVEAAVVLLGDQPLVRAEAITALVTHWRQTGAATVVPVYGERRGNPVLFARIAWPALRQLTGDAGARELLRRGKPAPLATVTLPPEWWPRDLDTWDDYRSLIADLSRDYPSP